MPEQKRFLGEIYYPALQFFVALAFYQKLLNGGGGVRIYGAKDTGFFARLIN